MNKRCSNPASKSFKDYGARGIKVCDGWKNSFEQFLADMGKCPPGHTLERNDNEAGYSLGNCRWASRKEQSQNKRNIRWIEHDGKRLNLTQWAELLGIGVPTLHRWLASGRTMAEVVARTVCSTNEIKLV